MNSQELEILRKHIVKKQLTIISIALLIDIALLFVIKYYQLFFFVIVFEIIITILLTNKEKNEFIKKYKDTFVLESLKNTFTNLTYEPEKGLDPQIIHDTKMMNMGDRYNSNDYIKGKYKGINVELADVHIEEEHQTTDSNGHTTTTYITIFQGKWMIFDFNKQFKANVQVSQKGFMNDRRGRKIGEDKYKKIELEDPIFNKKFKTYAQNEHDAFYIITPSLMEKIKSLTEELKGKILLCFINNELHIGFYNNKDSFEPNLYKKIDETKILEEVSSDIKIITNFIDKLNLDNDLFRKEV